MKNIVSDEVWILKHTHSFGVDVKVYLNLTDAYRGASKIVINSLEKLTDETVRKQLINYINNQKYVFMIDLWHDYSGKEYIAICSKNIITEEKEHMVETEILKVNTSSEVPENYTGIIMFFNGLKGWFQEGKLHRVDGPALKHPDGTIEWFKNGKKHREDGPAVESPHGDKAWWFEDKLHRVGGPALEYSDGSKFWYFNGLRHREDGPACEYSNGRKQWRLEGVLYSEEEFNRKMKR